MRLQCIRVCVCAHSRPRKARMLKTVYERYTCHTYTLYDLLCTLNLIYLNTAHQHVSNATAHGTNNTTPQQNRFLLVVVDVVVDGVGVAVRALSNWF